MGNSPPTKATKATCENVNSNRQNRSSTNPSTDKHMVGCCTAMTNKKLMLHNVDEFDRCNVRIE